MIKEPLEDEVPRYKGKRHRTETACADKRRYLLNCGLCGSENVVYQGVYHCAECGREEEFLEGVTWIGISRWMTCCSVERTYTYRGQKKTYRRRVVSQTAVRKCIDCGAVKGPKCPACGNPCWSKGMARYCQRCGYRRAE